MCVQPVVQTCRSKQVPRTWHNYKNAFVSIFKNCFCIERVFFYLKKVPRCLCSSSILTSIRNILFFTLDAHVFTNRLQKYQSGRGIVS